jgi:hypothetical protein
MKRENKPVSQDVALVQPSTIDWADPDLWDMPPLIEMEGQSRMAWDHQSRFLAYYAISGTASEACQSIGISYRAYNRWEELDLMGFRHRLVVAKQVFAESLERLAFSRLTDPQGNRGSDALLSHMLNAHKPEKYREQRPGDDTAKNMLSHLRSLSRKRKVNADGSEETEERIDFRKD